MNKGCVIWLTGLPCSGKTTIGRALYTYLMVEEHKVWHFDGDSFRKEFCQDLGFSPEDRFENIKRVGFNAMMMEKNNGIVICSFVSPYKAMRYYVRQLTNDFIEVHVDADLEVCMDRDIKGMYRKAIKEEIKDFTGYSAPYEKPENPEVYCNTDKETVKESGEKILKYLKENEII